MERRDKDSSQPLQEDGELSRLLWPYFLCYVILLIWCECALKKITHDNLSIIISPTSVLFFRMACLSKGRLGYNVGYGVAIDILTTLFSVESFSRSHMYDISKRAFFKQTVTVWFATDNAMFMVRVNLTKPKTCLSRSSQSSSDIENQQLPENKIISSELFYHQLFIVAHLFRLLWSLLK